MSEPAITAEELRLDILARDLQPTRQAPGRVEALLAANPGLAALGPFVPAGTRLAVPPAPAPTPILPSINPWE